jgi:hypothetical protein
MTRARKKWIKYRGFAGVKNRKVGKNTFKKNEKS